ncbi:MAG TPA: FHA domain-containing protein [Steroidobacteraceae bacterium]|nr:FHA domain-containing protein [Steroidobacteraceae bacterium]
MDKKGDPGADDGIVAEDVTQLMEHIELTGQQRLIDAPDWEMATPAADLDDAPILIEDVGVSGPEFDAAPEAEDLELFTETQFDLSRHIGNERASGAAELAAERLRWQKRVESLLMSLAERDELLAEREQKIEELSARLATLSLERASLAEELRDVGEAAGTPEPQPAQLELVAEPEPAPEPPPAPVAEAAPAEPVAVPVAEPEAAPATDATAEMPAIRIPRAEPGAQAAPAVRRYLIGLDMVGFAHEVTRPRVNIGRTHDNDLRILEPTVSRLHAMLTLRNGEATIVDANSKNGVFVNGIQVRYAKLEDGDVVTFGTVRFRYRVGGSTAGTAYGEA